MGKPYAPALVSIPQGAQPFDPWDEDLMHDLCGKRFGPVVADILIALDQFNKTKDSFGADAERWTAFINPKLQALKDACLEEMRDL